MPTLAQRLKEIEKVDDSDLLMGYRFLSAPRAKRSKSKRFSAKVKAKVGAVPLKSSKQKQ